MEPITIYLISVLVGVLVSVMFYQKWKIKGKSPLLYFSASFYFFSIYSALLLYHELVYSEISLTSNFLSHLFFASFLMLCYIGVSNYVPINETMKFWVPLLSFSLLVFLSFFINIISLNRSQSDLMVNIFFAVPMLIILSNFFFKYYLKKKRLSILIVSFSFVLLSVAVPLNLSIFSFVWARKYLFFSELVLFASFMSYIYWIDKKRIPEQFDMNESYLIKTNDVHGTIKKILALDKYRCLCFTRENPKMFNVKNTSFFWISEVAGKDIINPVEVEKVNEEVRNFMKSSKDDTLVVTDSISTLVNFTTFEKILHFLQDLIDYIPQTKSTLIVVIDPNTLDRQEISILEKEFKVVI